MKVFFDDKGDFMEDLDALVQKQTKFKTPIIVVPEDNDVATAKRRYEACSDYSHVTFISYNYWLSKQWVVDGDYDHIDFFRIDQFFINRSFGTKVGIGTMRRVIANKKEDK